MNHLLRAAAALLLPVFAMGAATVHAQETFRVGFVNPDRVLREAQPAKAAQAKDNAEQDVDDGAAEERLQLMGGISDRGDKKKTGEQEPGHE